MTEKTICRTTTISFTYLEWLGFKGILPQPTNPIAGGKTKYKIKEVPEDKREYFAQLGLIVHLAVNRGKGMRNPYLPNSSKGL